MKHIDFEFNGTTYALSFTAEALFTVYDKFGYSSDVFDATKALEPTAEGWKNCCWLAALMASQGELQRRNRGETPQDNSKLVSYTKISPSSTNPRNHKIDKITIHHMAGNLSIESCGEWFSLGSTRASSNYGIGSDGRVGMYVEEKNRAWTSSDRENDMRAVTIEVADCWMDGRWSVTDEAYAALIELCVDICQRNGIEKLNYTGDKSGNLTMHKWFADTDCPGDYLESKFPDIAAEVNKKLGHQAPVPDSDTEPIKPKRLEGLPLLKRGSEGETVRAVQILLIGYGISCGKHGADGDFGPDTENAVEVFQEEMNQHGIPLEVDGKVGPETYAALMGLRG